MIVYLMKKTNLKTQMKGILNQQIMESKLKEEQVQGLICLF